MHKHIELSAETLASMIASGTVRLGGNQRLRIYGSLKCRSGMLMKRENRVFFRDEEEAIAQGYRPCGRCMKAAYQDWVALRAK